MNKKFRVFMSVRTMRYFSPGFGTITPIRFIAYPEYCVVVTPLKGLAVNKSDSRIGPPSLYFWWYPRYE
jgi:hypothetical protein